MNDLKIDDLLDVTIRGGRLMYTVPDHSEGARAGLTQVSYGGTLYVLIDAQVAIVKPEGNAPAETTTAADETRVSDERVQQILDRLNGFIDVEYEGGTILVDGRAVSNRVAVGADYNLDEAVDWALDLPEVSIACGPDADGSAEVELRDGTVLAWEPDRKQWTVTVSDECDTPEVSR